MSILKLIGKAFLGIVVLVVVVFVIVLGVGKWSGATTTTPGVTAIGKAVAETMKAPDALGAVRSMTSPQTTTIHDATFVVASTAYKGKPTLSFSKNGEMLMCLIDKFPSPYLKTGALYDVTGALDGVVVSGCSVQASTNHTSPSHRSARRSGTSQ